MRLVSLYVGGVDFFASHKEPGQSFQALKATTCVLSMCAHLQHLRHVWRPAHQHLLTGLGWFVHPWLQWKSEHSLLEAGTSGSVDVAPVRRIPEIRPHSSGRTRPNLLSVWLMNRTLITTRLCVSPPDLYSGWLAISNLTSHCFPSQFCLLIAIIVLNNRRHVCGNHLSYLWSIMD